MPNVFLYQVVNINLLSPIVSQILLKFSPKNFLPGNASIYNKISNKPFFYSAGHYATVLHTANEEISPLSIACAPYNHAMLEFHLYHPAHNQKAYDILRMCRDDNGLQLRGPFGTCTIDRLNLQKPIIFLAFGTGFAPIKAIIEEIVRSKQQPNLHLYWVSDPIDFYMADLVMQWSTYFTTFNFTPLFPRLNSSLTIPDIILKTYTDLSCHQVYACGPSSAITTAYEAFTLNGLKSEDFYSDVLSFSGSNQSNKQ